MRFHQLVIFLLSLLFTKSLSAIIFVGGGNSINLTPPGNGVPWEEVARVTNSDGTHKSSGSAVHLGGGYMLTANHVGLSGGYVSFDGENTIQIANGSAVQVTSGTDVIDLKVFQLIANPGTSGVNLLPEIYKGVELMPEYNEVTHIGWGVGHDPTDTSNPWVWGSAATTSEKRWGINNLEGSIAGFGYAETSYDFEAIYTALDTDASVYESAATLFDSGSGLFIKNDLDNWFLAGTIVAVMTQGSSTFSSDETQDLNFAVRISEYADEIHSLLANPIPVPEASTLSIFLCIWTFFAAFRYHAAARSKTPGCRRSL